MGGLNSLGGLNNMNVDFRPAVELTAPEKEVTAPQQPVSNAAPENAPLQTAVAQMKDAVANVRENGLEIVRDDNVVSCIEVDRKMGEDENKKGNFVGKYLTNSCPSYYKRDYLHKMFN